MHDRTPWFIQRQRPQDVDFETWFWDQFKPGPNGCLLWGKSLTTSGYGQVVLPGGHGTIGTHILAYWMERGEVPDGMVVRHTCIDQRDCGNPDHLILGTPADNSADMVAQGRQSKGTDRWSAKLTEADVREIRALITAGGLTQAEVAARFGVHQIQVSRIVRGITWKHVR